MTGPLDRLTPRATTERLQLLRVPEVAVAALCPVCLLLVSGPAGAVVGLFGASLWLFAPVTGFALAQLGVLLAIPGWPGLPTAVAVEGALAALLLAELVYESPDQWTVVAFLCTAGVGGLVTLWATTTVETWVVALGLVFVAALAAYGVHRYELLQMGRLAEVES